ncbi:MAG: hypothetical protein ABWK00_00165 [Desulfurococcaceae archaeon]
MIPRRPRRIQTVFRCPSCGYKTLTVRFNKGEGGGKKAYVVCGTCGLYAELPGEFPELYQPVDIYARFIDLFESGAIEVEYRKGQGEKEGGLEIREDEGTSQQETE